RRSAIAAVLGGHGEGRWEWDRFVAVAEGGELRGVEEKAAGAKEDGEGVEEEDHRQRPYCAPLPSSRHCHGEGELAMYPLGISKWALMWAT
ncbi:hypothetical protein BHE74_00004364, partial [Ensete ventricosum]